LASSPLVGLFGLGIVAGAMITVQSVLNASLGGRAGLLGSVLLLTLVSIALLIALILVFPSTANFRSLPGPSEWYLYLAAPIFLVPRLGAALTLTAIVLGQLVLAVVIDHFGLLAAPKIEASLLRVGGVALIALGAFLVSR
jgi:transporter family-2 protein